MSNLAGVVLVIAIAAGCSNRRSAPASAPPPPADDATATSTTLTTDAAAAAAAAPDPRGAAMAAETVARAHYATKGWAVSRLEASERVPFLFRAELADGIDHVLVHDGAVVATRGVGALAAYAGAVGLAARPDLDIRDVTTLLVVLEALPPVAGYAAPQQFYDGPEHPTLVPRLERSAAVTRIVFHYIVPRRSAGGLADPRVLEVRRWTLELGGAAGPAWREETLRHDPAATP